MQYNAIKVITKQKECNNTYETLRFVFSAKDFSVVQCIAGNQDKLLCQYTKHIENWT